MKKEIRLFVDILLAVAFFAVTRFLLTGIQFGLNDFWQIALLIGITFYFVYASAQKKGLSLREIGLGLPKKNHWLLIFALMIGVSFFTPVLFLPGKWVIQPFDAAYWLGIFLPKFLHSGLGSGICEELLFRGYLMKHTEKQYGRQKAIFLTSLVFGLVHLLNGGFTSTMDMVWTVFDTGMLGAILAMLTYATGSLVYPMIAHAIINVTHVFVGNGILGTAPARVLYAIGEVSSQEILKAKIGEGLGCVLVLAFLIWYSKKHPVDE